MKLVHPQEEKQNPGWRERQAEKNNRMFEKEYGKNFSKGPGAVYRDISFINPFLKRNALDFYGGHVTLQVEDKTRVLESELIRDYQIRLQQAEEEKEAVYSEH